MYLQGITDEQYKEAAALADALIERLKMRVLGREVSATSCNCGAMHNAAGLATRITRTAERYPEQVLSPFSVEITPHGSTGYVYRLPLTTFIPWEEMRALWKETFTPFLTRHFPSVQETLRSGANDHLWDF